jgi:hypothetical protein
VVVVKKENAEQNGKREERNIVVRLERRRHENNFVKIKHFNIL